MAIVRGPFVVVASDQVVCLTCRWCGTAGGAVCQVDDVVRCPKCAEPLDFDSQQGDGADPSVVARRTV